jgi:hypothetical protein
MKEEIKNKKTEDITNKLLRELIKEIDNPVHKRIINSYKNPNPIEVMETELGKILLEVLRNVD